MSSPDQRFAYGLRFQSDFPLPELASDVFGAGEADVIVELAPPLSRAEAARCLASDAPLDNVVRFGENDCQILFSQVGRFSVVPAKRNTTLVRVEPLEGTPPSSWRLPLLGSILALVLERHGLFALHGGAARFVDDRGEAVAAGFLGDKGAGKSTLHAALSQASHPLFCDDVLGVDLPTLNVLPGFASLKLTSDAVREVLHRSPAELDLVAPGVADLDKRSLHVALASEPCPLRHLFVLGWSDEEAVSVRRLSASESLLELFPHTFAARWSTLYLVGERQRSHFRALSRVVSTVCVWKIARPKDISLVNRVVRAVERVVEGTQGVEADRPLEREYEASTASNFPGAKCGKGRVK